MTDEQEDIVRAIAVVGSLYGLMRNRINPVGDEVPLGAQELSATIAPDRRLVVLGHDPISGFPRHHGTVADQAAMLALHTIDASATVLEPRFVAPGDSVQRADDPGWSWHCIAAHGQSLSDWERRPLAATIEAIAAAAGGAAGTAQWGSIGGSLAAQADLAGALGDKADADSVAAPLNDDTEAGGESLVVSGPGGTLRRLVAGTGITLVAAAGTLTINAAVSGEQPLGIISEIMDYGPGTIRSTDGGLGWAALGGFAQNDYQFISEVMDYGSGTITTTTGGTGWSGAGTFTILD